MTLVVDASVAFKWFIPETGDSAALALLDGEEDLIAPELLFTELGNAMWVRLRRIEGGQAACSAAQKQLHRILHQAIPVRDLIPRAIEIAFSIGDTVYDSVYLAICEREGLELVTADQRLIDNTTGSAFEPLVRALK